METEPGWDQKLHEARVNLVCLEPAAPLAHRLAENTGWKESYCDPFVVIFARISPR
jgi:hypothetical protein